jgi:hypothetical protein
VRILSVVSAETLIDLCVFAHPDRVESEHLGNKDQYRVTREMPLPYRVEPEEEEEDGHDAAEIKKSWIPVLFH